MTIGTGEPGSGGGGIFPGLNRIEKLIAVLSAAALLLQTVLAIVNTQRTSAIDERIRQVEIGIKQSAEFREQSNLNASITKEVFTELKSIVEKRGAVIEERVERLLVGDAYSSTIPDLEIRLAFREAIKTLNERTITSIESALAAQPAEEKRGELLQQKARLEDLAFSLETDQAANRREIVAAAALPEAVESTQADAPVRWSNYDFDIFWCDETPKAQEAKALADELVKLRVRDQAAAGTWRVRPLPQLTNLRPGYRVSGYEIRISSDDERPFGEQLATEASKLLESKGSQEKFLVRQTQRQTRWYISVFVCPS